MKRSNKILVDLIILFIFILNLHFIYSETTIDNKFMTLTETDVTQKIVKIKCEEMSCSSCKKHITLAVTKLTGIEQVDVNLETKIITVIINNNTTTEQDILNAIIEAGYEAELMH